MEKNIKNYLLFFIIIFIFNSCRSTFINFKNHFYELNLPFTLQDSTIFNEWNDSNLIELIYVKKFNLFNNFLDEKYTLHKLEDYKFSYVGKFKYKNYFILLYRMFTTDAGRGNPIVVLTAFSKDGKKGEEIIALWNDAEDPFYSHRIKLNIRNDSTIIINSVLTISGFLEGQIVPKKITKKEWNYAIQKNGKIKLDKETSKDVFIDNNPKILDDFPQD